MRRMGLVLLAVAMTGCTTIGSVGIIGKSNGDMAGMIKSGRQYKELGMAEGKACKSIVLGAFPGGNADIQAALDNALSKVGGGDALINVTTASTLYSYLPIYNVYAVTCVTVRGMAIKFQDAITTSAVPFAADAPKESAQK